MTTFQPFVMERMMSQFEQDVEYNLSESGVHPMLLRELLADDPSCWTELLATELNYPHVNGIPQLRENIAALYDGATADNVLVTVGRDRGQLHHHPHPARPPGDEIVIMLPNYMQIWGIARNHGLTRSRPSTCARTRAGRRIWTSWKRPSPPRHEADRRLQPQQSDRPHPDASRRWTPSSAAADRVGAWILADEVYSGAERLTDEQTPSFYGRYDKVMAMGSMSKAYGLPGLRIGWVVGPPDTLDEIWARHEYTTISATMLSNKLAALALSPEVRPRIIAAHAGLHPQRLSRCWREWMDGHGGHFRADAAAGAAAIAFVRYHLDINSTELVERLRQEKSVLIVPGDHFGLDHFLRISFGLPHDYLMAALDRIHELIVEIAQETLTMEESMTNSSNQPA